MMSPPIQTFRALVRTFDGAIRDVTIEASSPDVAVKLLEAQYGPGCLVEGLRSEPGDVVQPDYPDPLGH
jgi:hypothetical protein